MGEIEDLQDEISALELEKSTMVEGWMATYGDMVTLLLCFFVLLFAFATIDVQKFRELVISLKGTLGVLNAGERLFMPGDVPKPEPSSGQPSPSAQIASPIPPPPGQAEKGNKGEGDQTVRESFQSGAGEVLVLPQAAKFEEGSDELTTNFKQVLDELVPLIKSYKNNEVSVVGHADPRPVRSPMTRSDGSQVTSNWQLAADRAYKVIDYFVNEHKISEGRFSLVAYSSHKLEAKKLENEGDYRRVDIIFRPKFDPTQMESIGALQEKQR